MKLRLSLGERNVPHFLRPVFRIAVTLAGFLAWLLLSSFLFGLMGFTDSTIVRQALSSFPALIVLYPFWRMVPGAAGIFGSKQWRIVLCSSAALFIPFLVVAFRTSAVWEGAGIGWIIFAGALFVLAANEEILCRGFMMDALSFSRSVYFGLYSSSLIFALLHAGNPHASFAGMLNIFLAGVFFGYLRVVTEGLFYPIIVHWLWNLMTGMVFGWSVSGNTQLPSLLRPAVELPWGGFGPEESVLMTLGTLGAAAMIIKKLHSR
ncbi:MAG: CPBP family intramembrane metalloprotease [Candidatus Aegiribacteria sp.]|nr:CPBP family intramembrane metalloprotease [Candidatus Aegiribacteria sp.]